MWWHKTKVATGSKIYEIFRKFNVADDKVNCGFKSVPPYLLAV